MRVCFGSHRWAARRSTETLGRQRVDGNRGSAIKPLKPYMLRRWRAATTPAYSFFTCARPGRTGDATTKVQRVPDELVRRWVLGLPGPKTAIVSLLGKKPDGLSEFSFYSFYGGFDLPSDKPGRPSFQEWLERWHPDPSISVREHPTTDFQPIPTDTLNAVAAAINELLLSGRTVVLVDSGGQTRTKVVCKHIQATEDSSYRP